MRRGVIAAIGCLFFLAMAAGAIAAPRAELWPRWQAHGEANALRVDHRGWDLFLRRFVVTDDPSGINRLRYCQVTDVDRQRLESYLQRLQQVFVSTLNLQEQKAYWINLYNALTVKVILDHYPVAGIRDIDISGFFKDGPWDRKLVTVEGIDISLNDIEHRILRPIWGDNRVHYALNCASRGCPNLQPRAYTVDNMEQLLEQGARDYVNHSRGVALEGDILYLSSIYDWYGDDFGGDRQQLFAHLSSYAEGELAATLAGFTGTVKYRYDWALNE